VATQRQKYHLSLAGEYYVAAQLQRLGLTASLTYGNAKSADIVVLSESGRGLFIEVKTSNGREWPVGSRVPRASEQPWVFVAVPDNASEPPEFFVLTQSDLHNALFQGEAEYFAKYREKHGRDYHGPGVAKARRADVENYRNNWQAILRQL
jgi:hypothetical protein